MPRYAYRRSAYYRRRTAGRRTYRRRNAPSRGSALAIRSSGTLRSTSATQIHNHARQADLTTQTLTEWNNLTVGNNHIGNAGAAHFSLDQVPNYTELVELYSWYKFGYVVVTFTITNTPVGQNFSE